MRSLFLKIFLSYWLAQALFVVLAILVTITLRQRGEYSSWEARQNEVLSEVVQTYENGGQADVRRYLEEVRDSLHVRAYFFDEHGQEVSGRAVPHWAESVVRGASPPRMILCSAWLRVRFRRRPLPPPVDNGSR